MMKLLFLCFSFLPMLAFAQAPNDLRGVYKVVPIAGGTTGQAGATGYAHTGVTLASVGSCLSGGTVSSGANGYTLSTAGATYDGCNFNNSVNITAANITLKRSRIVHAGGTECGDGAPGIKVSAGPTLVQDVELTTPNLNAVGGASRLDRTVCVATNAGTTVRRLWAHDSYRGLDITGYANITVVDSYHGPNVSPPTGQPPGNCTNNTERAHASAIRAAGGTSNVLIRNTVLHIGYCSWASGLIALYPEGGANHDITINGGRWIIEDENSGGYGISVGCSVGESENYNFKVMNLQISTQYYADGCPSGCDQSWSELAYTPTSAANAWTNVTKYNPGQPDHGQAITAGTPAGGTPGSCPG